MLTGAVAEALVAQAQAYGAILGRSLLPDFGADYRRHVGRAPGIGVPLLRTQAESR